MLFSAIKLRVGGRVEDLQLKCKTKQMNYNTKERIILSGTEKYLFDKGENITRLNCIRKTTDIRAFNNDGDGLYT